MSNENAYTRWVEATTNGDSLRAIAARVKNVHSTVQRRIANKDANMIIELAEAYDANPLPGLLAAELIDNAQIVEFAGSLTVDDLSDVELAQIMVDRLEQREREQETTFAEFGNLYAVADSSENDGPGSPDDYEP